MALGIGSASSNASAASSAQLPRSSTKAQPSSQGSGLRLHPGAEFLQQVSDDSAWGATSATHCLTPQVLSQINEWFKAYTRNEKLQCLLAFFHAQPTHLAKSKLTMQSIIDQAVLESDEWVRALGRLLNGYPATGAVQCCQVDSEFVYRLTELARLKGHQHRALPLPRFAEILGTPDRPPVAVSPDPDSIEQPPFSFTTRRFASVLQRIEQEADDVAAKIGLDDDDEIDGVVRGTWDSGARGSTSSVSAAVGTSASFPMQAPEMMKGPMVWNKLSPSDGERPAKASPPSSSGPPPRRDIEIAPIQPRSVPQAGDTPLNEVALAAAPRILGATPAQERSVPQVGATLLNAVAVAAAARIADATLMQHQRSVPQVGAAPLNVAAVAAAAKIAAQDRTKTEQSRTTGLVTDIIAASEAAIANMSGRRDSRLGCAPTAGLQWDVAGLEAAERAAVKRNDSSEPLIHPTSPFTEEASEGRSPFTEASGNIVGIPTPHGHTASCEPTVDGAASRSGSDLGTPSSISLESGSTDDESEVEGDSGTCARSQSQPSDPAAKRQRVARVDPP
mmetsp:Transcript_61115/g.199816  ORF Transcript_61115/g.199816 Transcript_61115/m.199816 type:complete len:562 (-) Transcript_61115:5-1690(-)